MSDPTDVLERASAWLQAAQERGINVTDENGYLAVISDLAAEVEFQRTALQGYRNEQLRLVDAAKRRHKLLQRVLQCGLCEEPHGVGFTPSRQERIASELARDIGNELRGVDALVLP